MNRQRRAVAFYTGPSESYWRFMAGRPVTDIDFIQDQSLWMVAPMSTWHHNLLCAFLRPANRHNGIGLPPPRYCPHGLHGNVYCGRCDRCLCADCNA